MDLLSDGSAPQFQLDPIQRGQDAKILFGAGSLGGGFLVTSGSNTLSGVIEGVTIDLLAASDEQTTLTIERDDSSLSEGLQALVDAYNSLRDKADQYDSYDSESLQKGTLYGNANLRSFVSELTRIVTQDVDGLSGPIIAPRSWGVHRWRGSAFEAEVFTEALAVDREGVEALLSATLEEEPAESAAETPVVEGLGPGLIVEGCLSRGPIADHPGWHHRSVKANDDSIAALRTRILLSESDCSASSMSWNKPCPVFKVNQTPRGTGGVASKFR